MVQKPLNNLSVIKKKNIRIDLSKKSLYDIYDLISILKKLEGENKIKIKVLSEGK